MDSTKQIKRLYSLDALRGADMLMISGGGTFIALMQGKTDLEWLNSIAAQMNHPGWLEPITFYDFIFPLFLFISGVSLAFSIKSSLGKGFSKTKLYKKAFKRMIILMLLGLVYKNSPINIYDPGYLRYSSVLGRIGIATFLTTVLYVNFSVQKRLFWVAGILLSYYAAIFLIPAPGYEAGDLSFEGNIIGWIDRAIMPGRLINGTYDENAIATSLPAFCLTILGAWAGDILRGSKRTPLYKTKILILIGSLLIGIGLVWSLHFPIVKKLWSSSFIAVTAGVSFLVLAIFYWLIDVKGFTKWAFFFKVIGMNSLVIYFAYHFINFNYTSHKIFSGIYSSVAKDWIEVFDAFGAVILVWAFLYFLFRKKWFVKI